MEIVLTGKEQIVQNQKRRLHGKKKISCEETEETKTSGSRIHTAKKSKQK